ncbi:hypothetical protein AD017_30240 (plasmid) [Pseudonocardia sp. EC080619-01]|nr:hypothetical protein AD017_30240 [Pseudonocardia sp. EC080619-01]
MSRLPEASRGEGDDSPQTMWGEPPREAIAAMRSWRPPRFVAAACGGRAGLIATSRSRRLLAVHRVDLVESLLACPIIPG